ncbi:MAG: WD40 repeat domain-containing protein [Acidobacteriia bacterium]|nr:WD40 repeat domain-containing protein [Terriglobia bacterium]
MRLLTLLLIALLSSPLYAAGKQSYSMTWHPAGKLLAVGRYQEVVLTDAATNQSVARLTGHADAVRAVAFSPDGKWLAAAGGKPAKQGEVKIWNVVERSVAFTLQGHDDCIYAAVFSPDGKTLATASYDKLIKLWDTATGQQVRTLKDHIDAIYALAFTPDGRRLISGAADRSIKVWNPATGERLFTMSEALDGINTIAISPAGNMVAAGGLDKSIRIWKIEENSATLLQSLMAHEDAILKLAWSPDGKTLVSFAADRTLKVLRASDLSEVRLMKNQSDWAFGVEFSPDGKSLAVARFDGSLTIYDNTQLSPSATQHARR